MSLAARQTAFAALLACYHNSFANESAVIRHSPEFIKRACMHEAGKAAMQLDPRLTSTNTGAVAVGIAKSVMTNETASRSLIDVEIAGDTYVVTFDDRVKTEALVSTLAPIGQAAVLCKPGDQIGTGLIAKCSIFAVEPTQQVSEAFVDMAHEVLEEAASPLSKAVATSIKSWGKEIGVPVRTKVSQGKSTFVQAWQHSDPPKGGGLVHVVGEPIAYSKPFPEEHRKKALKLIYPNNPELHDKHTAGNIGAGSMTMSAGQWTEFFKGTPHEVKQPTNESAADAVRDALIAEAHVGPIDKEVWARAESEAERSYGSSTREKNPRKFYGTTMVIYKNMKGVKESGEDRPHNFEWNKIPHDAKVHDLGHAFAVDHPDGRKGVAFWGSHDAHLAHAHLRAMAKRTARAAAKKHESASAEAVMVEGFDAEHHANFLIAQHGHARAAAIAREHTKRTDLSQEHTDRWKKVHTVTHRKWINHLKSAPDYVPKEGEKVHAESRWSRKPKTHGTRLAKRVTEKGIEADAEMHKPDMDIKALDHTATELRVGYDKHLGKLGDNMHRHIEGALSGKYQRRDKAAGEDVYHFPTAEHAIKAADFIFRRGHGVTLSAPTAPTARPPQADESSKRITVKVTTKDGDHWHTGFNGSHDEAKRYFMGRRFETMGHDGKEKMREPVTAVDLVGESTVEAVTLIRCLDGELDERVDEALAHKVDAPDGTQYRVKKVDGEWQARAYVNGKHHEPWTSYHADDKDDAINTANFKAKSPFHATGSAADKMHESLEEAAWRGETEKHAHLASKEDGVHRWGGASYEKKGEKYRQVYAAGHPASGWRKLRAVKESNDAFDSNAVAGVTDHDSPATLPDNAVHIDGTTSRTHAVRVGHQVRNWQRPGPGGVRGQKDAGLHIVKPQAAGAGSAYHELYMTPPPTQEATVSEKKHDIYVNGIYVASTTQAKSPTDAVQRFKARGGTYAGKGYLATRQLDKAPDGDITAKVAESRAVTYSADLPSEPPVHAMSEAHVQALYIHAYGEKAWAALDESTRATRALAHMMKAFALPGIAGAKTETGMASLDAVMARAVAASKNLMEDVDAFAAMVDDVAFAVVEAFGAAKLADVALATVYEDGVERALPADVMRARITESFESDLGKALMSQRIARNLLLSVGVVPAHVREALAAWHEHYSKSGQR